jgi:hypothetical protein
MRILFIARRFSYLKNFEAPILQFARRGHAVHLVALIGEGKLEGTAMVERWAECEPKITFERLSRPTAHEGKSGLSARISMMVDYLRYLDPAYQEAQGLVERARRRTSTGFLRLVHAAPLRLPRVRRAACALLRRLEAAAPRRPEFDALLRTQKPDVVLFTPLIALQSEEQEVLTAAVEQGLRTVFCVMSWDNLSSKAVIRTMPDLVTVWNDTQRDEAQRLHHVPGDRIAVTGAQTFDHWFDRQPSRSRVQFLNRVGLPSDRPFLLWVCSSLFRTSPMEARFVRRWIEAIRASAHPVLRTVPILVRPHPTRLREWSRVRIDDLAPTSLWGANPVDPESRNDYFDSLFYSAAVVGLNTSAFLEAAIVGRPVYTVLLPEFRESQEDTLHFPYLLKVAGGLLHAADDMDTHMAALAAALDQPTAASERSRRFVEAFIRPRGLDTTATSRFVAVIEQLMQQSRRPPLQLVKAGVLARRLYLWLAPRSRHSPIREWLTTPDEHMTKAKAREARKELAAQQRSERNRRTHDKAAERHRRQSEKEAARAERLRRNKVEKDSARAERLRLAEGAKQAARAERLRQKEEALRQHRAAKRSRNRQETHQ